MIIVPSPQNEVEAFEAYKAGIEARYRAIFPLSGDPKRGLTYNELHQLFPDASKNFELEAANAFIERLRHSDPNLPFSEAVFNAVTETKSFHSLPRSMKADILTVMPVNIYSPDLAKDPNFQNRVRVQKSLVGDIYTPEFFETDSKVAAQIGQALRGTELLHDIEHFDSFSMDKKKEVMTEYTKVVAAAYGVPVAVGFTKDSETLTRVKDSTAMAKQGRTDSGEHYITYSEQNLTLAEILTSVPHEVEHTVQDYMVRQLLLSQSDEPLGIQHVQARLFAASYMPFHSDENKPFNYIPLHLNEDGYNSNPNELHSYCGSYLVAEKVLGLFEDPSVAESVRKKDKLYDDREQYFKNTRLNVSNERYARADLADFLQSHGDEEVNSENFAEIATVYKNNIAGYAVMLEVAKHGKKAKQDYLNKDGYFYTDDPQKAFDKAFKARVSYIEQLWEEGGNKADGLTLPQEAEYHHEDLGGLPSPEQVLRPADRKPPRLKN